MMVDLGAFDSDSFEAKAWVNEACRGRHPEDPVDKHLADLEIKLQLMAENIASSLEDQSSNALLRIPRASRDSVRIRDDAASLRSLLSSALLKLKQAEDSCKESVAALAKVDIVKQRMEAANGTLQDAAGLAQLSAGVEAVFASGDLPRVAETLANMRKCLSVIGEVSEFANMKRQLEQLEDRLEGMVQPRLSEAISQRKIEVTQGLRDILITVGRFNSLEQQYIRVRLKPLCRIWEELDSGKGSIMASEKHFGEKISTSRIISNSSLPSSFVDWLPQFYDEILLALEQEWKWCSTAFPEDYKSLVARLLTKTMSSISPTFLSRIDSLNSDLMEMNNSSSTDYGISEENRRNEKRQTTQLGMLISLHTMTGAFARNVYHLLGTVDLGDLINVLRATYSPYENYKQRYGELEHTLLSSEMSALDLSGAVSRSAGVRGVRLSETVQRIAASIPSIIVLLEAAVDRCLTFTGGSEIEALLRTLDDIMIQYLGILQEVLKSLRVLCGVDTHATSDVSNTKRESSGGDGATTAIKKEASMGGSATVLEMISDEDEWAIVQGALQLLAVADSLSNRTAVFESTVRATLVRLGSRLQLSTLQSINKDGTVSIETASGAHGVPLLLDTAVLRLIDTPDKTKRLSSLLEQAKDPRFHALGHTPQRVTTFVESVNELVYDVLIFKVRSKLAGLAVMPIWSAEAEENLFDLPTFSSYASSYISSIGEYLLTLPQQLETLSGGGSGINSEAGEDGGEESQFFATEWMFRVAEGATALFIEQLRGIQFLSERGAQQLSADVDYLCKVLSALSMQSPSILVTFQTCVSTPKDKLVEMIRSDTSTTLDMSTIRLICKMRRVPLD